MFYKYYKKTNSFANQSVRNISKSINTKKIGHNGILDPMAEGLMIVASDYDTKLLQYIANKQKTYIAKCSFGYASDTLDATGEVVKVDAEPIELNQLIKAIEVIKQQTTQIPPIYSAKKINGKKGYEYARANQEVEIPAHKIKIFKLDLLNFDFKNQTAEFEIEVSEGTYIRTLLVDLAKECNNNCIMTYLKRTKIGEIDLTGVNPGEFIDLDPTLLFDNPTFKLVNSNFDALKYGRSFELKALNGLYFGLNSNNEVATIGRVENNTFFPKNVFNERLK
ncbi:tRNA pseudouridine(55) synthase TruB [Mycoplasma sp. NEAQ87857]|uniref:tRNA pseudouridine(55) synthase TruB n=1 Tax=Mycoplasma sp. NEAQ87857 TaxID=2683967 RepID=UPI00131E8933|nr:tRNA pseudouridine(55) synthase TruB [Mycoplasma sp. NEAQ87857]